LAALGLAVVFILVLHVLGRAGAYCSPIRADSFTYATLGYRIAHGEVLYRDMPIDKPPGLMWLCAPVYLFAPPARWPLIPLESLGMLLGYLLLYKVGRELYGRGIALALAAVAALAVNVFLLTDFTVEGFGLAEGPMLLTSSVAVLCYLRACRTERRWLFGSTGVLLGLGLLLKQTALPLVAAVALHRTASDAIAGHLRRGLGAVAAIAGGLVAVLGPAVTLLAAQGALQEAVRSVTIEALPLLRKTTAWPARWADVRPLWVPVVWCVIGLAGWCRRSGSRSRLPHAREVSFLLLWLGLECLMLLWLPRRSYHYYAISCLPVIFLSGLFWTVLHEESALSVSAAPRWVMAVAAIWSVAYFRPAVDVLVPTTIARCRNYDAAADQRFFDECLRQNHAGTGRSKR